jgi:RHS repeat-associated protein
VRVKSDVNGRVTLMPHPLVEIDASGAIVPWIVAEGRRLAQLTAAGPNYLHADALGSTRLITDRTGAVVSDYDYGAWGEISRAGAQGPNGYLFTGSRSDGQTGLTNMNARYYNAEAAHFISADPLVPDVYAPQTLNRYAYVLNDPVSLTDRSGYEVDCVVEESGWGLDCTGPRQPLRGGSADPVKEEPAPKEPQVPDFTYERELYKRELIQCGICHADPGYGDRPVTQADRNMAGYAFTGMLAVPTAYVALEFAASEALLEGSIIVYRAAPWLWNSLLTVGGAIAGIPSGGGVNAAAVPRLAKGEPTAMLGPAVGIVKGMSGSASDKARMFRALADQVEEHALVLGKEWEAQSMLTSDGSFLFVGTQGRAFLINAEGRLFAGDAFNEAQFLRVPGEGGMIFTPIYEALKAIK